MPKCIMPPADRPGVADLDGVAEARAGGRPPTARSGPAPTTRTRLPRRRAGRRRASPRSSARSPRKRSTAWMLTAPSSCVAVARRLRTGGSRPARARRAADCRRRDRQPGLAVAARLREGQPRLDVLAGRAGVVAGRQEVDVLRPLGAGRAGAALGLEVGRPGEVFHLPLKNRGHAAAFMKRS